MSAARGAVPKPWRIERVVTDSAYNRRQILVLNAYATYGRAKAAHEAMSEEMRRATYIHFRDPGATPLRQQHNYHWGGSRTRARRAG